jgi:restriction system protein
MNDNKVILEEQDWKLRKENFYSARDSYNKQIDLLKQQYFSNEISALVIEEYCKLILTYSAYPFEFPKLIELIYSQTNKILAVNYQLPIPENLPKIKDVKFIAKYNEIREYYLTENQINKMYDSVTYKIVLRSIHELFYNDKINAIEAINFNGWTTSINKSNGNVETNCIVSIYVTKDVFQKINLQYVDPKQCFKNLKGVGSTTLYNLSAIQPIMTLNKDDKRIIQSKDIQINEGTNLASMDWDDFEHLVRELFEKEFSQNGGEVKVTQASRDGGVDAIAFDPDPIRGGKIVIQAKRYTNTVGVSAVRDLYGTLINEGATKGILITTSDYGKDSYDFANGKPLTLLNGGHLLYLLEKHGQKAHIDIVAAKQERNL